MEFKLEYFYQLNDTAPRINIIPGRLYEYIGFKQADRIILQAADRILFKTTEQVRQFYEHGGREPILMEYTDNGNVYVDAVELTNEE